MIGYNYEFLGALGLFGQKDNFVVTDSLYFFPAKDIVRNTRMNMLSL